MKFMKLGTRPDTFFTTSDSARSISSEVPVDLKIQVNHCLFHLHKFPLLSKCSYLQKLYSEISESSTAIVHLTDVPGGADTFEACAKFCYCIAITISAANFVAIRCAAEFLGMTDATDHGNLVGKLDSFFNFCVLRGWRDTLMVLQSVCTHALLCDELGVNARCVTAITAAIVSSYDRGVSDWWMEDIVQLGVEDYGRIMAAVKSTGVIPSKLIANALEIYVIKWLPLDPCSDEVTMEHELLLLEKVISLLPMEKRAASCGFLLRLLKLANSLNSPPPLRAELCRRIGRQLEEAPSADDLLIPPFPGSIDSVYDVDAVMAMLEGFLLQGRRSPPCDRRVAELIDGCLQKIARDESLPMEKLIAIAEAVPDLARGDHDDLYRAIDIYLRAHPSLDKNARKQLCRVLDCRRLSVEACTHAARNELLPLRVVVQVFFSDRLRAAAAAGDFPGRIRALLAKTMAVEDEDGEEAARSLEDDWNVSLKRPTTPAKLTTLRMRLEEEEEDMDEEYMISMNGLVRSASVRLKRLCSIPKKPKRIICRLLAMNRSASERRYTN